ncbi:MAG: hypothetical protein EXR71_03165 [Myxococcales bacterium]|nr:hypothetical protein [Myxococcales bacterium]
MAPSGRALPPISSERAPTPSWRRWIAVDGGAALALAALPLVAWAREGVERAEGQPWWVLDSDQYLFGPDAAAWAQNALALNQGRLADLDPHRLPTWTLFTSWAMDVGGWDVALAGHLVNRLEHVLLGPVLYVLGRALGLGPFAFAAAAIATMQPALLAAACHFGIDPTVTFLLVLMLLASWAAGRRWWFAPVAGSIAALTMVAHLTALAFPLCGLGLCLTSGKGVVRRGLAALIYAGAGALLFRQVFTVFPMLPQDFFANALAEGVTPSDAGMLSQAASQEAVASVVRGNAGAALDGALRFMAEAFQPIAWPWPATIALIWLGFVGPRAFRRPPGEPPGRWPVVRRVLHSLAEGFFLASACAPLLAFAAAKSPERYSENLLPVAALLICRGAATLVSAAGWLAESIPQLIHRRWHLENAVAVVLVGGWVVGEWREPHQRAGVLAPAWEKNALLIGRSLAEHFPAGGGGASALREALPYAGLLYCPSTVCPFADSVPSFHQCVAIIREECAGTGAIPLVVTDGLTVEQRPVLRGQFEAWVEAQLPPVATVGGSRIYSIPRHGEL